MNYSHFADLVLLIHFAIVLFVVGGLLLIVLGNFLRWSWVNHWWFRAMHLLAISVVVLESWLGIECPLTTLENWLRLQLDWERLSRRETLLHSWLRQQQHI